MSPFRQKGGHTYYGYVRRPGGARVVRTLGTRNAKTARLIQDWLTTCAERRRWDVLDAIANLGLSAGDAYDLAQRGALTERLESLAQIARQNAEPDLSALVVEWSRTVRSDDYVRQVRVLIPAGVRFPVSQLTRARISAHLASLDVADPTRNRHRTAISQFARWLVERDILPTNPVRDVRGFRERDPRMVHHTHAETLAISRRLARVNQAFEAFMWGAGLECGAVQQLRRRDIVPGKREVTARGSKNRWRARVVRITNADAWAIIDAYLKDFMPDAPLFDGVTEWGALAAHKAACVAAGVTVSTLHDWRHTYAIRELRNGLAPQTVKRQLGHSPHSTMLERVYAAWIPKTDADYLTKDLTKPTETPSSVREA